MATEVKTKTLVYKVCTFHRGKYVLEDLIKASLKKRRSVGSRRQSLAPENEAPIWLVIGQSKLDDAFAFGLLVQYTPGMTPSFLIDDAAAPSLAVEHLKAPKTADGKDRQLLEAMLFFAASGNHLVMMQSQSLKSLQLERHLQWLLHDAKELEADNTLKLNDSLPKKVRNKLEATPVRSLTIGGELASPAIVDEAEADDALPTVGGKRVVSSSVEVQAKSGSPEVLQMLKGLVGPSKASKLELDDIDGSNIEYSLQIRYKRSTTEEGQKFMNGLGSALRHAEGIETKIRLVGGGSISGDDLRLTGPIRVTTVDGVPAPDEVFEAMRTWLLARVKSGDVRNS